MNSKIQIPVTSNRTSFTTPTHAIPGDKRMTITEILIPTPTAKRMKIGVDLALPGAEYSGITMQEDASYERKGFINISGSFNDVLRADYIIAYCDDKAYYLKSRSPEIRPSGPPRRPDRIVAIFRSEEQAGKLTFKELPMRDMK